MPKRRFLMLCFHPFRQKLYIRQKSFTVISGNFISACQKGVKAPGFKKAINSLSVAFAMELYISGLSSSIFVRSTVTKH